MYLTRQDKQIINNFSKIQRNLEFKKDLATMSNARNIVGEYTLQCDEFKPFLIYETPTFLRCLNSFLYPSVEILDDKVFLSDEKSKMKYFTAERAICLLPKEPIKKTIGDLTPDTQFEMSFSIMKDLQRVNEVLRLPNLIIKPDEDNFHSFTYTDIKDKKSNEFSISTYHKTNRNYEARVSNSSELPIMISNYKVSIFEHRFMLLECVNIPLKYLIALKPKPQPDSKKESKTNA
jgi:hypothetical protein